MINTSRSKFQIDSKRAISGLAFQEKVVDELVSLGVNAVPIDKWLKSLDPCLADGQIWMLEKTWGDIVCKRQDSSIMFLECVSALSETTSFPISKICNFKGTNKWYVFGWDDKRNFVPSIQWNSYASKIEKRKISEDDAVILVDRKKYTEMRCGISGIKDFCIAQKLLPS